MPRKKLVSRNSRDLGRFSLLSEQHSRFKFGPDILKEAGCCWLAVLIMELREKNITMEGPVFPESLKGKNIKQTKKQTKNTRMSKFPQSQIIKDC